MLPRTRRAAPLHSSDSLVDNATPLETSNTRSNRFGAAMAVLFIAVFAFLLASFPARNPDVWGHLAAGRDLANGHISAATATWAPGARLSSGWLYNLSRVCLVLPRWRRRPRSGQVHRCGRAGAAAPEYEPQPTRVVDPGLLYRTRNFGNGPPITAPAGDGFLLLPGADCLAICGDVNQRTGHPAYCTGPS